MDLAFARTEIRRTVIYYRNKKCEVCVDKKTFLFDVIKMNLERKRPDGVQGLPSGWKREEVVRRKGLSAGKIDVFYTRCVR